MNILKTKSQSQEIYATNILKKYVKRKCQIVKENILKEKILKNYALCYVNLTVNIIDNYY